MTEIEGNNGGTLKPFEPGQSGNPNGRPKGKSISTILKDLLEGSITIKEAEQEKELTRAEAIALKLLDKAITNGDIKAISEILDRTEGKAPQTVNVETNTSDKKLVDWFTTDKNDKAE